MKTRSETRFEEYCIHRGYSFDRIQRPESAGPRADYRLRLASGNVICEVKQIETGPWEEEVDARMKRHGSSDLSRSIGGRARAMIKDAARQLKRHREEKIPLVIFAMDLTWHDHLSEIDVDAAMFGRPTVRFHPDGKHPDDWRSDFGHAGGRQMTEKSRLYLSALCVMQANSLALKIFHNPFAEHRLFPHYFPHPEDRHFIKEDHPEKAGQVWFEYVGSREKMA
jgi:hypothetical protein